ncbi:MAG: tetratricopeptide repeat protein, partial [Actinomycetota bacterium]|nr:tetratricopeptide repeat protein [Actinomycetota bacterium]
QTQGGRPADGAQTLAELERRHPNDIQTRLLLARRALLANEPEAALIAIEAIALQTGQPDALRVLSRVQERLGKLEEALATLERAIRATNTFDASLWARKAELLRRLGRPGEALAALRRLDWGDELTSGQLLLRARCEYDLGRRAAGRQRLIDLLEQPSPPIEAALEFYERERDHPASLPLAREALVDAHERAPDDHEVLRSLIDIDVALGQPNFGAVRVNQALARRPRDPRLYALRARLMLAMGSAKKARADAERALALTPGRGDEALEVLITLAELSPDPQNVIAPLERQRADGKLTLHRKVILGRMLARTGRSEEGLALFEEALEEGARFTTLKADTAYLLVLLGGDLDRAEALAREAVAAPGEQVFAANVLGHVYMAKDLFAAAMYQFQFAAEHARPANPDYLLHLGQALERMSRPEQARDAYARALEIDPKHVDSRAALGALEGADPAPRTDPS